MKFGGKEALQFMGIEELEKQFESLPGTLQRNVLRKAVAAGGSALVSSIRKHTPKLSGTLRRSLKKKPSSKWRRSRAMSAAGIIGIAIGHDYGIGPHSHLVNYGHTAVLWGLETGGWVSGNNYFAKGIKAAAPSVRAKVTAKARQSLHKAVVKQASMAGKI